MATASKKSRAPRRTSGNGGRLTNSASLEFLVFEDNGGNFHWTVVTASGERLAQSPRLGRTRMPTLRRAGCATELAQLAWNVMRWRLSR